MPLNPQEHPPELESLVNRINEAQARIFGGGAGAGQETANADPAPQTAATENTIPAETPANTPAETPATTPAESATSAPAQTPANTPPAAPTETAPPAPQETAQPDLAAMEQRWKTADGIAKATGAQLSAAQQRLQELEARLARQDAARQQPPINPTNPISPMSPPVVIPATPQQGTAQPETPSAADLEIERGLVEDFGPEIGRQMFKRFSDLTKRRTDEAVRQLKSEFEPIQRTVEAQEQNRAQTEWNSYLDTLFGAHPDAADLYQDPEFQKFVGPGGMQSIIANERARQAQPVIDLFNLFKKSKTPAASPPPPVAPVAAPPPTPSPSDRQREAIRAQAQPRPASSPALASDPRRYSQDQFRALYRELGTGKYSREETARLKRELDDAYASGRVG